MLFSALHVGSGIQKAIGNVKDSLLDPTKPSFLTRAGQALVTGRYDRARQYAVEALMLYGICKYTGNQDRDASAWMILGISVRLAMRMGYHRDPRHLPTISPFEGEMRRRAFMVVETFDLLLSSQAGLPAIIHEDEYDAEPPSNLFDTDFDEDSKTLPLSRPPTDPTPMLYYCYKGRLAKMLRGVFRHALSLKKQPYETTLKLDNELCEIKKEVPPSLQMRPLSSSSITDEAYMIFWRLNVEMMHHRGICVLHREYLSHERSDPSFDISRLRCTHAALEVLKHQAEFHTACQPGGQLFKDRWMMSSINFNDFLVAAMIIGLDLYESHNAPRRMPLEDPGVFRKKMDAVKLSYEIWNSRKESSRDARRASRILAVILSKLPSCKFWASSTDSSQVTGESLMQTPPDSSGSQTSGADSHDFPDAGINTHDIDPQDENLAAPLDTMFNDPENINWVSNTTFSSFEL